MAADTRQRMVRTAAELVREHGTRGTSISLVLRESGAPRGSVGHHFPGGREQLILEAVTAAGAEITGRLQRFAGGDAGSLELVEAMCDFFAHGLERSDFRAGCPVAAVACDGYDDPALRRAADEVVDEWLHVVGSMLRHEGHAPDDADSLAQVCISMIEGALLLCRIRRSVAPLHAARGQLARLLTLADVPDARRVRATDKAPKGRTR